MSVSMTCDLQENRRRRKWEYLDSENAPCICQRGFALDGTMAREWWLEMTEVQTESAWGWLNEGHVLEWDPVPPILVDCWFRFDGFADIAESRLQFDGSNEVREHEGLEYTVDARLILRTLDAPGGNPFVQADAHVFRFSPPNNGSFAFGDFEYSGIIPGDPPLINGTAIVTPLRACHECGD